MFKKFIYVILINLLLILSVLAEVEELKDKSDYNFVNEIQMPYLAATEEFFSYELGKGNSYKRHVVPANAACKGVKDIIEVVDNGKQILKKTNGSATLIYAFDEHQWVAKVWCGVFMGTGTQEHLRKTTDNLAQKHCEQYDRNALFKGSAQFKLQPVSRVVKVWLEAITSFGMMATRNVSVAYYCDKDPDPKLVEMRTNKSKENLNISVGSNIVLIICVIFLIGLFIGYKVINKKKKLFNNEFKVVRKNKDK